MTRPEADVLGKDARALIRAARGGDDVPDEQRQRLLELCRQGALEGRRLAMRNERGPRFRRLVTWALGGLLSSGSLVALAQGGVLQRLGAVFERAEVPESAAVVAPPELRPRGPRPLSSESSARVEPAPEEMVPSATPAAPAEPMRAEPQARDVATAKPPASAHGAGLQHVAAAELEALELDMILGARNALAERQFELADERARRHASRFPNGAFSEEREAILALSECRAARGKSRGQRFVERRPSSLFAERVRRDCALGANAVPNRGSPATPWIAPPTPGSKASSGAEP